MCRSWHYQSRVRTIANTDNASYIGCVTSKEAANTVWYFLVVRVARPPRIGNGVVVALPLYSSMILVMQKRPQVRKQLSENCTKNDSPVRAAVAYRNVVWLLAS